jgi:hypothetical protein
MGYASKAGRARTSAKNPRAHAICDRCGFRYNRDGLSFQYDWRGPTVQNTRMLVCRRCEDLPQEQLRSITLPADPVPISNPRVELFATDSTNYMTRTPSTKDPITGLPVLNQTQMSTVGGSPMTGVPVGAPNNARRSMGLDPLAQMKLVNGQVYGVILPVMSVISNGTPIVTVTCSSPHGLSTNAQVGVLGINNPLACGAFSITVTTATAFTYEANFAIPTASLLTSTTIVNTLNVGVPWNYSQIPQTGA